MKLNKLYVSITGLLVLGFATQAEASGFQVNEMSPPIQATALADAATAVGVLSGMAFNPAVLATVPGTQIYVGGSAIIPDINYTDASGTVTGRVSHGISPSTIETESVSGPSSGGNIGPTAGIPALYASTQVNPISPNLKIGVGVNTQWGLTTTYPDSWPGIFDAVDSTIKTVDITPTIAYQITPWLALGAGLNVQRISATLSSDVLTQTQIAGNLEEDTVSYNSLSGVSWATGYVLGALFTPRPGTNIGIDYRSQVTQNINGNIAGAILAADTNAGQLLPTNAVNAALSGTGDTSITLPAVVNIGVSQAMTQKFTLMADAQYTDWNSLKNIFVSSNINTEGFGVIPAKSESLTQNFNLNWCGSWLFSLGGQYQLTPRLAVLGGVAYDETPTNNTDRDARIPDSTRQWISTGVIYNATQNLAVDFTFTHIIMNNQSIDVTQTPTAGQPTYTTMAQYTGNANILAAGLNYTF